jgi:hypothetical protein
MGRARQATDDNIIRRMRFACWITKATDTHSEYVIILAFARQKWLRERAQYYVYKYIAFVVLISLHLCLGRVRSSIPLRLFIDLTTSMLLSNSIDT